MRYKKTKSAATEILKNSFFVIEYLAWVSLFDKSKNNKSRLLPAQVSPAFFF